MLHIGAKIWLNIVNPKKKGSSAEDLLVIGKLHVLDAQGKTCCVEKPFGLYNQN